MLLPILFCMLVWFLLKILLGLVFLKENDSKAFSTFTYLKMYFTYFGSRYSGCQTLVVFINFVEWLDKI